MAPARALRLLGVLRAGSIKELLAPVQTKSGPLNSFASVHWVVSSLCSDSIHSVYNVFLLI